MAICAGCGGSFNDTQNFCPNCGRTKSKEEEIATQSLIECLGCGQKNDNHQKFCQSCGKSIVFLCKVCGNRNLVAANYCGQCGVSISESIFTIPEAIITNFIDARTNLLNKNPILQDGFTAIFRFIEKHELLFDKINNSLSWPYPIIFGQDIKTHILPINHFDNFNWFIDVIRINKREFQLGQLSINRTSLYITDYEKNSRTIFLFENLTRIKRDDNSIVLSFKNYGDLSILFNVGEPTKRNMKAIQIAAFGVSVLGEIFSSALSNETETEKQIRELREDLRRRDSKSMTPAEQVKHEHRMETEAFEVFIPFHMKLFEDILKEKKQRGII